jgi:hypothetical protein
MQPPPRFYLPRKPAKNISSPRRSCAVVNPRSWLQRNLAIDFSAVRNPAHTAAPKSKAGYVAKDADALELYDIVITIQSVAKNEFSAPESLSAFRIGIFPPKENGQTATNLPNGPTSSEPFDLETTELPFLLPTNFSTNADLRKSTLLLTSYAFQKLSRLFR